MKRTLAFLLLFCTTASAQLTRVTTNEPQHGAAANVSTLAIGPSFTPGDGELLVVFEGHTNTGEVIHNAPTDGFGDTGGTSWTATSTGQLNQGKLGSSVWYRQIGTGASASQVTINFDVSCQRVAGSYVRFTGHNTTTPIRQDNSNNSGGSGVDSLSIQLGSAVLGTSITVSGVHAKGSESDITPGNGETEIGDTNNGTGNNAHGHQHQHSTSANHNWTTLGANGTGSLQNVGHLVEVAEAVAGGEPSQVIPVYIGYLNEKNNFDSFVGLVCMLR